MASSKDALKNEDSDHGDGEQGAEDEALDGVLGFVFHASIITYPGGGCKGKVRKKARKGSHMGLPAPHR